LDDKPKKAIVIYNPNAGMGMKLPRPLKKLFGFKHRSSENCGIEENIRKALESLKKYNVHAKARPTAGPGDATQIARESAKNGCDLIIAAGGDGTINEVANGMAFSDAVLGVLPMGTANVFALQMNLPMEIDGACRVIASGNVAHIDMGKVEDRYFLCMAGIGFDALTLKLADKKLKKTYGALAYAAVAFKNYFTYSFPKITLEADDRPEPREGCLAIVCNGKYYGGQLVAAPDAKFDDGMLDVCLLKKGNIFAMLLFLFGLWKGNVDKLSFVECFKARKIRVAGAGKHPIHVDAEYLLESPANIEVCENTLKVAAHAGRKNV